MCIDERIATYIGIHILLRHNYIGHHKLHRSPRFSFIPGKIYSIGGKGRPTDAMVTVVDRTHTHFFGFTSTHGGFLLEVSFFFMKGISSPHTQIAPISAKWTRNKQ